MYVASWPFDEHLQEKFGSTFSVTTWKVIIDHVIFP